MAHLAISRKFIAAATALCAALVPVISLADDAFPSDRVEFTLFGGYRFGGARALQEATPVTVDGVTTDKLIDVNMAKGASYSLVLNWESEFDSFYELAYSKQSSTLEASIPIDVSVEYLQIGGYYLGGSNTGKVHPYFLMTVGMGRLAPDDPDLLDTTKFAAAIGGGVKIPFTEHFAMRIDARLYALFLESESNVLCRGAEDAQCKIHLEGDTLIQPEISLGLTFGF